MVGGLGGGMNIPVLTFLVILPAIGAVLLMLIPGKLDRVIKWTALSFSTLALAISIGVFLGFDKSEGGFNLPSHIICLRFLELEEKAQGL